MSNRTKQSLSRVCIIIIDEIKRRLIEPLCVINEMAQKDHRADELIPKIVDDFEKSSKKMWKDIKKEIG